MTWNEFQSNTLIIHGPLIANTLKETHQEYPQLTQEQALTRTLEKLGLNYKGSIAFNS